MSGCKFREELLQSFADGEATAQSAEVEQHLRECARCRAKIAAWRDSGEALRRIVDLAVGEVDTLQATARIRERIAAAQQRSLLGKLSVWWDNLWTFHRRALAGVGLAAALGALSAPAVVYYAARYPQAAGAKLAGVFIESMEWGNDTRAVIYRSNGGSMTLIWMEPTHGEAAAPSQGIAN